MQRVSSFFDCRRDSRVIRKELASSSSRNSRATPAGPTPGESREAQKSRTGQRYNTSFGSFQFVPGIHSRECTITDRLIGPAGFQGWLVYDLKGGRGAQWAARSRCSRFLTALAQFHSNRSRLIHGVQFNPDPFRHPPLQHPTPTPSSVIHILNCQSLCRTSQVQGPD